VIRIALISPKGPLYRHRGGIFRRSLRYAPLTLPTLASLIPADIEHEVTLIDEGIEDVPHDLDADLIGMTVITGTAPRAYDLAHRFRARGIPVVLGGPHVTLVPDEASLHADAVVVGYAEASWPRLLRDFVHRRMRSRYDQDPDLSLAGLPPVRRDLIPRRRYLTTNVFEATRGCVHPCDFCVVPSAWGRRPLQKPVEEVVDEIRRTGARKAIFVDLNLIADRAYAAALFEALIPLRIEWYGLATTLLAADGPLLDVCARSGCRGLLIGFESLSAGGLAEVRKRFNTPDSYREVIEALHARRIAVQGTFVFGLDDDTADIFLKTARFAVTAGIDLPRFAILTPFPGTPLFDRLAAEGRILSRDWSRYDGQHVVFQPAQMSIGDLERGTHSAWRHAYSYASIARRLRAAASPLSVFIGTNLGYRFYARNLKRFYTCDWPAVRDGLSSRAGAKRRLAHRLPDARRTAGKVA
jgi:radical SAM superfamily enzyme YgiQ (UPF0313 family)